MAGIKFSEVDGTNLEPAIAWRFRVTLPTFAPAGSSDVITVSRSPSLFACAFSVNQRHLDSESSYLGGSVRIFPTAYMIDAYTIRFVETKDFLVLKYFRSWMLRVVSREGYFGLPKDYKRPVSVTPLDATGVDAVTQTYADSWPGSISSFDLDGTQQGFVMHTVTFNVDNCNEPNE